MNRNLTGGYYIVSLGDVELLGESVSLPDVAKLLYEAKKYKFVVFQDIVIGGNKKVATPAMFEASMAYTTEPEDWDEETDGEFVPEPIYTATIYNFYGKNIAIDADGVASVTDVSVSVDPATLYGKFVRIIDAPESTTLTDEQIELFKEGIFVNGDFVGMHNPIFLPCETDNNLNYMGIAIGRFLPAVGAWTHGMFVYHINRNTKVISVNRAGPDVMISMSNDYYIGLGPIVYLGLATNGQVHLCGETLGQLFIKEKLMPNYPTDQTDKTYVLKLVNGTLTWVEETA